MKLNVFKRKQLKQSESNRIRREGNIPAIVYERGKEGHSIAVSGSEFSSLLRTVLPGRLSTTVFSLKDEDGKEISALIKDIQYHTTTYKILHLDFEELSDKNQVNVNVPIECVGAVDCIGVKLGGVIRQVVRHMRVRCFPKDIPHSFTIDVRSMGQNDKRRLSDLEIPESIKPISDLNEVAVIIAKR